LKNSVSHSEEQKTLEEKLKQKRVDRDAAVIEYRESSKKMEDTLKKGKERLKKKISGDKINVEG